VDSSNAELAPHGHAIGRRKQNMRQLWRSPTLRSVLVYGTAGLGFAGANLILARALPTVEYGVFTLVIALVNLSYALAPAGIDGIVNRRHLEAGPRLLSRTVAAGVLVGIVFVAIAELSYQVSMSLLLVIFISTVAGGVMAVAGAQFQSEQRYGVSLALYQSPNLTILVAAAAVLVSGLHDAALPLYITALGFVVAAGWGWWVLFRERATKPHRESSFPWGEALSVAGLNAAGLILIQLDRLVIPYVLPLHDLATFGVLAATAGSMFRVLFMAVGFTLVPRLRAAGSVLERRHLIAHEAKLVGAIVAAGSLAIWFVIPLIERWFLAGKYHLAGSLVLAALVSGVAKIMNAFARSTVTALATPSELSTVNLFGWVSVGLAIAASAFGSRWGLAGVMYGVALGWLVRALAAYYFTLRHLKLPASVPATAQ
jgi:O-antigen/teichoic acid export membrane protein